MDRNGIEDAIIPLLLGGLFFSFMLLWLIAFILYHSRLISTSRSAEIVLNEATILESVANISIFYDTL